MGRLWWNTHDALMVRGSFKQLADGYYKQEIRYGDYVVWNDAGCPRPDSIADLSNLVAYVRSAFCHGFRIPEDMQLDVDTNAEIFEHLSRGWIA